MKYELPSNPPQSMDRAEIFQRARAQFRPAADWNASSPEAEGGCGVTGFACTIPVRGRHIYEPSIQMRNRGNGKGGGIAACGLVPEELGVSRKILEEDYILQVALLDANARGEVEKECIEPFFDIHQGGIIPTVSDYRDVPLLDIRPPDVARYFVRVKPKVLAQFAEKRGLTGMADRDVENEFVYQNSIQLNDRYYSSLGDKRAFVLSHARNLIILKIVGFAEASVQYYEMGDTRAHVWIAHQRYPTKGRVWHPGGAHPFIGMNEALVHNGDFANYHSVSEYLSGRNIFPQFLTDTEVSVLLFDLWNRVYGYPMEYIIEALAPTGEMDFDRLTPEKQRIYRQIQATHIHASPDGPWFFIIARSLAETKQFQLMGITDTSMLRPQVFAIQQGEVSIGLICSEKQAIDATLASLASEDPRFTPVADRYWNARGGSHTDGGAFLMTVTPTEGKSGTNGNGKSGANGKAGGELHYDLAITNKFGQAVTIPTDQVHCNLSVPPKAAANAQDVEAIQQAIADGKTDRLLKHLRDGVAQWDYDRLRRFVEEWSNRTATAAPTLGIELLTQAIDYRYPTGSKKRSSVLTIFRGGLEQIFQAQPLVTETPRGTHCRIVWDCRAALRAPVAGERTLLVDARGFQPEGVDCDATLGIAAYRLGWRHMIHYSSRGTRFHGAGFGPASDGLRIDCYDNPGDYLGSGMDGLEIYVHGNAQDQLGQISKRGKLVVYGDIGQTFLYGAKGGDCYVMGNAAGRPIINAVGRPKVIINGTALDFLAESFMAGDPHNNGGFAIVNGLRFDEHGHVVPLDEPYPGSNLLSLASGGAIYVRDPHGTLRDEQLNGGAYRPLSAADWKLILPYLRENERLFDIQVERDLLTVDGVRRPPREVYRKVLPLRSAQIEIELEQVGG